MLWFVLMGISGGYPAERDFECLSQIAAAQRTLTKPEAAAFAPAAAFYSGRLSVETTERDYEAQALWAAGQIKSPDVEIVKSCVLRMGETQGFPQPNH